MHLFFFARLLGAVCVFVAFYFTFFRLRSATQCVAFDGDWMQQTILLKRNGEKEMKILRTTKWAKLKKRGEDNKIGDWEKKRRRRDGETVNGKVKKIVCTTAHRIHKIYTRLFFVVIAVVVVAAIHSYTIVQFPLCSLLAGSLAQSLIYRIQLNMNSVGISLAILYY